jgi:DNA-directed RNA polymerase specialized sigma subunit
MEQTYEWIRLAQAGDAAAKNSLLQENSGLIWSVVGRFRGRPLSDWCNRTAEMYRKIRFQL